MAARESLLPSLCSIERSKKTWKSGSAKIVGAEDANKRRFCRGSLDLVENPCRTATIYYRGGGSGRGIRSSVAAAYKHEERGRWSGERAYAPQLTPYRAWNNSNPPLVLGACSITHVFETPAKILLFLSLSFSAVADTRRENEVVKIQWTFLPRPDFHGSALIPRDNRGNEGKPANSRS